MISIKSSDEMEIMKQGGKISTLALKEVLKNVKSGVSTMELDQIAEKVIIENGGEPSFKTVDDYKFSTCINVNEGIVHGLPNKYRVQKGDLVSVDLGTLYKGFHTDLSYTVEVETNKYASFLNTGISALEKGIKNCIKGKRIGDISSAIQNTVENDGYTVSEMLVGHGIGKKLHEDPYVPCYGKKNTGPKIKTGMTFAIEVIYQQGSPEIGLSDDGWTIETVDGSISGLFEKTVAVTAAGNELITNF